MAEPSFGERYFELLKAHLAKPHEQHLAAASDLGRELVRAGVPEEEFVEIHTTALQRLAAECPDPMLETGAGVVGEPLMEVFMTYALSMRQEIEERRRAEHERDRLIAELQRSNEDLRALSYTVAQSLNSPLITIRGFAPYLEEETARQDPERMRADIAYIGRAAADMQQLVDDLFAMARAGRLVREPEPVSFAKLARDAVRWVTGYGKESGASVHIAPDLPSVFGDPNRLRQVLENLIDNAVKHIGEQAEPRIEIGARTEGSMPVFFVRDNGIGIDARHHQTIFRVFERVNRRTSGMGLGLAIARQIIERHGGRIWVESDGVGHGSTFCFTVAEQSA